MFKCNKCSMLKFTDKDKCLCNIKPFNEKKFEKKANPKPIAQISEKKKERLQNEWTEIKLFKTRFEMLQKQGKNFCMVTWKKIEPTEDNDLTPSQFPHILNKWTYPEYRYFLNNIWLVCWIEEHKKFDEAINKLKEDIWTIELIKLISIWNEIDIKPYL